MSGLYGPFGSVPTFTPGSIVFANASGVLAQDNANFKRDPVTGLVQFGSGDDIFAAAIYQPTQLNVRAGLSATPITTAGPLVKMTKYENISAVTQPNAADSAENAVVAIYSKGAVTSTPQVTPVYALGQGGGTTAGADVCGVVGVGWLLNSGATGYGIGGYFEGRRDLTTGHNYGAEMRSNNNVAQVGVYNASGVSDSSGIEVSASGLANSAVGVAVVASAGMAFLYGYAVPAGGVTLGAFRDDSSATASYLINGSHTYGIDATGGTFSSFVARLPNAKGIGARNAANNGEYSILLADSSDRAVLRSGATGGGFSVDASSNAVVGGTLDVTTGLRLITNGATITGKDTLGANRTFVTVGSDDIIRVGWQAVPATNGHLILYAKNIEGLRLTTTAGVQLANTSVGFFGTAPITKQTVSGAKGSNAAIASLLTALAAYGIITDTTTA